MRMFIFKKDKAWLPYLFTIFDVKGRLFKITLVILFLMLLHAIFLNNADTFYVDSFKRGIGSPGIDNPYDYTIPYLGAILLFFVFYADFKDGTFEMLRFYHSGFQTNLFYRWLLYTGCFSIGAFLCGIVYYRDVAFFDWTSVWLSVRFLPNIIFMAAIVFFVTVLTKNSYVGFFVATLYITLDFLSGARLFKVLSLGVHAHPLLYTTSFTYYLLNRLLLISLSIGIVFIACKLPYRLAFRFKKR